MIELSLTMTRLPYSPRSLLRHSLGLTIALAFACSDDDPGEDLPGEGGFTSSDSDTDATNTSSDGVTQGGPTGDDTGGTTGDGSGSEDDGTTGGSSSSTDGGEESTTTGDGLGDGQYALPSGAAPVDVVVGSFGGDASLDVITLNANGQISVLLGSSTGDLANATSYPASGVCSGSTPVRLVTGNFDDANDDDVAVLCNAGDAANGSVVVLLSDGSSGFTAETPLPVEFGAVDMGSGDFTGDGPDDIIVGNAVPGTLSLLFPHDPNGRATESHAAAFSGPGPNLVAFVDLGGLGPETDALFAAGTTVSRLPGDTVDSTVELQSSPRLDTTDAPASNIRRGNVFDINSGDGRIDIIATSDEGAILIENQGGGAVVHFTAVSAGSNPSEADGGDVDGDGYGDLIIANEGDDTISIFIGSEDVNESPSVTTFTAADPATLDVGDGPSGIAIGDLDGDNVDDIITCNRNDDTVSVILMGP